MRRHLFALALVGWYLMVPPRSADKKLPADDSAPMSKWEIVHSYDSAIACENGRAIWQKKPPFKASIKPEQWQEFVGAFVCVASDDPRLKN
jgi:hypothetical protein